MPTTLTLTYEDRLAVLTLNRPEKRNALCHALMDEFDAALQEVAASRAQVLLLAAEGKAFSAGMDLEDLKALAGHTAEENHRHSERIAHLFRSLYLFPKVTIATVQGAAIAGGAGLATLCDFTLATPAASFGYTEVRIGFVPAIVSAFLIHQVGDKDARDLLLTGRIIGAEEALRMRLINEVVAPEALQSRARQLAAELLENSPASLRATKALLRDYHGEAIERDIRLGMEANAHMRQTADFAEGVKSFLERRKPKWSE